jgi:glycosyltransferase involved in cell wall biosynthesis
MRIGVIAGEMERRRTGVGRYLEGLVHGLSRWDHGSEWNLFLQGEPFDHPVWEDPAIHPSFSRHDGHPIVWEQVVLPWQIRNRRLDLLFCPAYSVPFGVRTPAVVTIHDLSFELLPGEFRWRERWRRRLLARRASRVARRVLVDSRRVAEDVRRCYGVPPERIGVVPLGIEPVLLGSQGKGARVLADRGVRKPYLLSVGTIFERRMPRLVLEAFAAALDQRPDLQLVVAGDNRLRLPQQFAEWSANLGIAEQVRLLGWVADEELAPLYESAELTFYLSTYEGFGIPPLESLAFGTPAVVGSGLALDDIWPDYPFRVAALELDGVVAVVRRILGGTSETAAVMDQAGRVLAGHGWEHSSRALVRELSRAIEP